jgi:hypothetical protein
MPTPGGAGIRDGLSETPPKVINFRILLKFSHLIEYPNSSIILCLDLLKLFYLTRIYLV